MVAMEYARREVARLQGLDGRLRREARTGEGGEDAASGDRLRLARRVSDDQDVVRVRSPRETKRDSPRDVQDRLGVLRILPHLRPNQHLFQVRVRVSFADA